MSRRLSKTSVPPETKGNDRATEQKRRVRSQARRSALVYFLALGLFGIGVQALHRLGPRNATARPLDEKGLRVSGEERSDVARVLPAALFSSPRVKNAYRLAAEVPETLNQLYCWCGCIEQGMRSNLECFETKHASVCDVCMAGAEVAWEMKQQGIIDPAKVQQVLDARFGGSS